MMKENIKIYLAWGPSGEYDTYYEECLGAFLKRENAEKAGKENPKLVTAFVVYFIIAVCVLIAFFGFFLLIIGGVVLFLFLS